MKGKVAIKIEICSIDEIIDKFESVGDMLERNGYDVVRISLKEEVIGEKKERQNEETKCNYQYATNCRDGVSSMQ